MIPTYEQPIDTTENIFQYNKVPLVNLEGSFWKDYLMASPNYWERKAGEVGVTFKTEEERDLAILNLVNIAGTHVMFENQEIVAYNALVNPALKEKGSKMTYE